MNSLTGDNKAEKRSPLRKITLAGLFVAAAILLSGVHFPIGPTRCYPFQHTINVLAGAFLGPWWAAGGAFVASLIRNMTGTGTLFAFPGSIPGAIAAGFAFRIVRKPWSALAEPIGTGPVGATISALILGPAMEKSIGFLALQSAFLLSSIPGALIGMALLHMFRKSSFSRYL
jgi:energy coupling factor transporter S component ThiW